MKIRVIDQYPFVRKKINRAAIWIAFKSAVRIVIQERKPNRKGKNAPREDLSAQQVAHVCKIFGYSTDEDNLPFFSVEANFKKCKRNNTGK